MERATPRPGMGWLKITLIAAACVVGLVILAVLTTVAVTYRGYKQELDLREALDRQYGDADSYRAAADGAIPADRVARFLAVRRDLLPRCAEVTAVTGAFRGVEDTARSGQPDPKQLVGRIGSALRRMPSMGLVFGAYVTDRNLALQRHAMGMGEYSWIYAIGYFAALRQAPRPAISRPEPSLFEARVFPSAARVIERHVAAANLTAGPWVDELARLRREADRVPFADGLPPELEASLAPHRAALAGAACPAAAELDLTITVRRAFGYDHR